MRVHFLLLFLLLSAQQSCGRASEPDVETKSSGPAVTETIVPDKPPTPQPDSAGSAYDFGAGMKLSAREKALRITDAKGALIAENRAIIRLPDESGDCPSEGFLRIAVKGDYFTIEQQTCGGWMFINEYVTFRYEKNNRRFILHKVGYIYTDRREPDKDIPQKILTAKDFGVVRFEDVDLERLIQMP